MPVSGIVIKCKQGKSGAVSMLLAELPNLEIHHNVDESTLVAVVDVDSIEDELQIIDSIMKVDGVIDVRLAYHNFEDLPN